MCPSPSPFFSIYASYFPSNNINMSEVPSYVFPVAATANGIFAGLGLTINFVTVPALRAAGYPVAGWAVTYKNGAKLAVSTILISSAMHFYKYYLTKETRSFYCGVASLFSAPFTIICMSSTNNRLHALNADPSHDKRQVVQLVEKWNKLQYARTIAGVVALGLTLF
ncbi:hypothetical protein BDA99DRAFT_500250 [Phascolomyces articulosus]|uniref:DUF1772-domain-containing protein n=1 Tax=Phascolomyces articulosus TaxID=60185 RepID=A0AAD5K649_9FUNG|nr:hypothetical protein BDA99DRAFT_500250 [Phascolomyces articulosus]